MDAARCLALLCALGALTVPAAALAQGPAGIDDSCVEPMGDPEPGLRVRQPQPGRRALAHTYIPFVFRSNQLGERIASYYTKAWFDLQLKDAPTGFDRLTARVLGDSADAGLGAGTVDPAQLDPADAYAGTVAERDRGRGGRGAVSFSPRSACSLDDPRGGHAARADMRKGC